MITWFDALLVTLLAILTALGARRGLSGFIWGLSSIAICLIAGALSISLWFAVGLAFLLSIAATFAISRLIIDPLGSPLFVPLGALGGFILGVLMISALALGFPLERQHTSQGLKLAYPSTNMPPALFNAINTSAIKTNLHVIWNSNSILKALVIPDHIPKK